jgi:hypothetical protein
MIIKYCSFPCFCIYLLNPCDASVGILNSTSHNIENTSLYDLMKINKEMATLIVKEQLNYFQIKKVIDGERKDPLVW